MFKHKAVRWLTVLIGLVFISLTSVRVYAANPTSNSRIIYWAYNSDENEYDIFSMTKDGTDKKIIIHSPTGQVVFDPVVSPDGTKIAYVVFDGDLDPFRNAIFVADINGHNQTNIHQSVDDDVSDIAWSADSTKLVYAVTDNATSEPGIWTIGADGANNQEISIAGLDPDSIVRSVAWSSTDKLLYARDNHLYSSDSDGSNPTAITSDGDWFDATVLSADWSADGSKVVFSAYNCPDGGGCIVTANADGTDKQVVIEDNSLTDSCGDPQFLDVSFSPDGTKILYTNNPVCV